MSKKSLEYVRSIALKANQLLRRSEKVSSWPDLENVGDLSVTFIVALSGLVQWGFAVFVSQVWVGSEPEQNLGDLRSAEASGVMEGR